MGFSLIYGCKAKWVDGEVIIDFFISNNVRREPEKFPGLPDGLEISVYRKEAEDFYYVKMRDEYFQTEDIAKAELNILGDQLITASCSIVGNYDLSPGQYVTIERIGKSLSGKYYVTDTTHTIDGNGYTTKFNLRRNNIKI